MKKSTILLLSALLQFSCSKGEGIPSKSIVSDKTKTVIDSSNTSKLEEEKQISLESIAKTICACEPVSVFSSISNNKLYYITEEKTGENNETLRVNLNIAEKIGNQWVKIKTQKLYSEEYIMLGSDDVKYSTKVSIKGKTYYFTPLVIGHMGTANNGLNHYVFVFYSIAGSEAPILIDYSRMSGEITGEYEIITKNPKHKNLSLYKEFLKETNSYIDKVFGKADEDIDSHKNFITKWNIENSHINISDDFNETYVRFLEYKGENFFKEWEENNKNSVKENQRYKVLAGFATPILAYDKREDKTLVLYVPDGFPNGCCWGRRSFYILSLEDNIVTA